MPIRTRHTTGENGNPLDVVVFGDDFEYERVEITHESDPERRICTCIKDGETILSEVFETRELRFTPVSPEATGGSLQGVSPTSVEGSIVEFPTLLQIALQANAMTAVQPSDWWLEQSDL